MAKRQLPARANHVPAHRNGRTDKKLVDETVTWIQATLIRTLHRGIVEIGDYVFDHFFDGEPERLRSKAPNKNASFRSLLERCESVDLPLRQTALYAAVASAAMRRQLPARDAAYKRLPPSHQAALLPLREPEQVERLAERVLQKGLSVRDVREAVSREMVHGDGPQGGRRRKPLIVKTLTRSLALFTLESGRRSFTKAQVEELSDTEARQALSSAQDLIASLQKLVEKLEARD
jgi:hypothetical protein